MPDYFYGWYLKCQSPMQSLAVIPAAHINEENSRCSIQIITDEGTYSAAFPAWTFMRKSAGSNVYKLHKNQMGQAIVIGDNIFCEKGVRLSICTPKLQAYGCLHFRGLTPLKYDIMGPFAMVPFMECYHSVYSMYHQVDGAVTVNGKNYVFQNALGYWEGDRGCSFPKEYLWTQCTFEDGALMLSVADIPMAGFHFTGIIGVVWWKGREYRLATYLGAKIKWLSKGMVCVCQGDMELEACLIESDLQTSAKKELRAPIGGEMKRTIHENIRCHARYRFWKRGEGYFAIESRQASFEYEYGR